MFGGFKATLNLLGGKRNKNDESVLPSYMFVTGAYRTNREDIYGFSALDPPKFRPSTQISPALRPIKSTSNLVQAATANPDIRKSTPAISSDPRGAEQSERNSALSIKDIKMRDKKQKVQEKQRLADQKKQAKEQAKQEKLMKERAKKEAQIAVKAIKQQKTTVSPTSPPPPPMPQPQALSKTQTVPKTQTQAVPKTQTQAVPKTQTQAVPKTQTQAVPKTQNQAVPKTQKQTVPKTTPRAPKPTLMPIAESAYSTNTLDSSISRSSGPPPYSETPNQVKDNVTLSKPVDTGSWDIISQHREQINRPKASSSIDSKRKQVVIDLNYNFGSPSDVNSEV